MAIEMLEVPRGHGLDLGGPLALPPSFDTKIHAAKWVKEGGAVEAAQEREFLVGTGRLTADGWQPWRDGESASKGKPFKVALQSGNYVLMYRPREIQDGVNAIYGNVGKELLQQERRGQTVGGVPLHEQGMLNDERLAKVIGQDQLAEEEGDVKLNAVLNVRRTRVESTEIEVGGG